MGITQVGLGAGRRKTEWPGRGLIEVDPVGSARAPAGIVAILIKDGEGIIDTKSAEVAWMSDGRIRGRQRRARRLVRLRYRDICQNDPVR